MLCVHCLLCKAKVFSCHFLAYFAQSELEVIYINLGNFFLCPSDRISIKVHSHWTRYIRLSFTFTTLEFFNGALSSSSSSSLLLLWTTATARVKLWFEYKSSSLSHHCLNYVFIQLCVERSHSPGINLTKYSLDNFHSRAISGVIKSRRYSPDFLHLHLSLHTTKGLPPRLIKEYSTTTHYQQWLFRQWVLTKSWSMLSMNLATARTSIVLISIINSLMISSWRAAVYSTECCSS